jgi:hypothetical protein
MAQSKFSIKIEEEKSSLKTRITIELTGLNPVPLIESLRGWFELEMMAAQVDAKGRW